MFSSSSLWFTAVKDKSEIEPRDEKGCRYKYNFLPPPSLLIFVVATMIASKEQDQELLNWKKVPGIRNQRFFSQVQWLIIFFLPSLSTQSCKLLFRRGCYRKQFNNQLIDMFKLFIFYSPLPPSFFFLSYPPSFYWLFFYPSIFYL